jgi:RND family efflux transporter MFP subunit
MAIGWILENERRIWGLDRCGCVEQRGVTSCTGGTYFAFHVGAVQSDERIRGSMPAGFLPIMPRRWLLLAGVAALGWCACDRASSSPVAAPVARAADAAAADPVVDVVTARVARGAIRQRVSAPGSLVARRESQIGAEVAGRLVRVFVSEGDRVEAGAPLFQIDPEPYEVALRQAEAGLDVARAERMQAESDLGRAQALRRQAVVSQQDLDRLVTAVAVARARERQAGEAVALARHNLQRTLVPAPYAASVAKRLADEGTTALVQPQTIVVVLQETAELEAHAAIPESQLALVRIGDPAFLRLEGLPEPIEAAVSAVTDTIDPATRTYLVKMRVPNPDRQLKAGVFVHVEILPQAKDALLVPPDAIRTEDGRTRVLAVRDGRAVAMPLEVGLVSEEGTEVLEGLNEGDEVIVGAAARTIAPGMRVRSVPGDGGPAA